MSVIGWTTRSYDSTPTEQLPVAVGTRKLGWDGRINALRDFCRVFGIDIAQGGRIERVGLIRISEMIRAAP